MTRHPAAVPPRRVHTLIIGSGAAGLAAAVQLHKRGIDDILVVTEGLHQGTSINTGSDKQTYYKLSLCGADADSPQEMAENYFAGGSMHGDLALAEAANSVAAFLHLADLGVAFPRDPSGQFIGYKTDHDPRQRATSVGPYTSRDMCRALIAEVRRRNVAVREKLDVVALPVMEQGGKRRIAGAVAVDAAGRLATFLADNVVFATGGARRALRDQRLSGRAHRGHRPRPARGSERAKLARGTIRHGFHQIPLERQRHLHAGYSPFRFH